MNVLRASRSRLAATALAAPLLLGLVAGCGSLQANQTAAPQELLAARAAYDRASHGPATQYDPVDLDVARATLERAELWYQNDASSAETRTQAYLAERRAQTADANGQIGQADAQRAEAELRLVKAQALALVDARAELVRTRTRLADVERYGTSSDQRAIAVAEQQGPACPPVRGTFANPATRPAVPSSATPAR